MSLHNITTQDGEFRYIVQWFNEWSELQRNDFLPIIVEYVKGAENGVYLNGIVPGMAAQTFSDKPMSLFQCRVKLFREWCTKWPENCKAKLVEKVSEIDPIFGEKLQEEMKTIKNTNGYQNGHQNGEANGNGLAVEDEHQNGHHHNQNGGEGDVIEARIEPVPNPNVAIVEDLINVKSDEE